MPSVQRRDDHDSWHHVMNRGIARRPVFETREDIRYFLSRIARSVRAGRVEVHAYAILATHFHLLLRSPGGSLSDAMGWVQLSYVRWFNRRRRRDGPLFRGRFRSCPITSDRHLTAALAYIDANPVEARLAAAGVAYPWCSAWHFSKARGPLWLRRDRITPIVAAAVGELEFSPPIYERFQRLHRAAANDDYSMVARRLAQPRSFEHEPLDDLVGAAPERVIDWMIRKTRIADGSRPGLVIATPDAVLHAIDDELRRAAPVPSCGGDPRRTIGCGLLRVLAGASWKEIGRRMACSPSTAHDAGDRHERQVAIDGSYARLAAAVVGRVIPGSVHIDVAVNATRPSGEG